MGYIPILLNVSLHLGSLLGPNFVKIIKIGDISKVKIISKLSIDFKNNLFFKNFFTKYFILYIRNVLQNLFESKFVLLSKNKLFFVDHSP